MSFVKRHLWLHYLLLGSLLFAGTRWREGESPRRIVSVPETRLRPALAEVERALGRPPDEEESRRVFQLLADQEVLFAYAEDLGIDREPVVQRRLAQIAQFITDNPIREGDEQVDLVDQAVEMGLREQDIVTRRIMIDGARRLIRAGALLREPSEESLAEYLAAHPEEFSLGGRTRMTHVAFSGEGREARAQAELANLRREAVAPEAASERGDPSSIPTQLPSLTDREIERLLGRRFMQGLGDAPAGEWSGPVASRLGVHLVYVHERASKSVPVLEDVRERVRAKVQQKLADEWLELRLEVLRKQYAVVDPLAGATEIQ